MHNYASLSASPKTRKTAAIAGVRGYSGLELARIVLDHPGAELVGCFASQADFSLGDYLKGADSVPVLKMDDFARTAASVDTIFLATPAETSAELAPLALRAGADVIDLSGAFRLEAEAAAKWYGVKGEPASLLHQAQYGLLPWAGPLPAPSAGKGRLIANPGCFATAALLALLPLLKESLIDPRTLVIDAKSGTTGAGKKAAENLLFSEVEGECLPYRVGRHQHLPEIRAYAARFAAADLDPLFVTHLLPVRRGILTGLYSRVSPGTSLPQIEAAYANAYAGYPFADAKPLDESRPHSLSLRRVVGTPGCEIRFSLVGDQLYVFSFIDNLLKGAASQAVENFNRLHDYPLDLGMQNMKGNL